VNQSSQSKCEKDSYKISVNNSSDNYQLSSHTSSEGEDNSEEVDQVKSFFHSKGKPLLC